MILHNHKNGSELILSFEYLMKHFVSNLDMMFALKIHSVSNILHLKVKLLVYSIHFFKKNLKNHMIISDKTTRRNHLIGISFRV